MTGPTVADTHAELVSRIQDLALALLGEPTERGRSTWRWGRRGSLAVVIEGAKRGAWQNHEAGEGGDPVGLIAHVRRVPMREAWRWAVAWLGLKDGQLSQPETRPAAAPPAAPRKVSDTAELARRIWSEAVPAEGSPVVRYLQSRGLVLPADAPLRFHPACPRGADRLPAMLALMTAPATGEPCGVHRTFLRADGSGKAEGAAKMICGYAGVIRLVPDAEVTLGLGLAEGIETALAVMQGFGWSPVWAATSAGAIAGFPVLLGFEALTIFGDADAAGIKAATSCAARWRAAGREARICAPPTGDFNDLIREAA